MDNDKYTDLFDAVDKLKETRLENIKSNKELYNLFLQGEENEFTRDIGEIFPFPIKSKNIKLKCIEGNCDQCYFYDGMQSCSLEYKDTLLLGNCIGRAFEIVKTEN